MNQTLETDAATDQCVLDVSGMDCASCVGHVTKAAQSLAGVRKAEVNLARGRAVVEFDPQTVKPEQIASAISKVGYPATPQSSEHDPAAAEEERLQHQRETCAAVVQAGDAGDCALVAGGIDALGAAVVWGAWAHHGVGWMNWLGFATATVAIIFIGGEFYRSAWKALLRGTSNMDTLIAMGASVAYGYSLVALAGRCWGSGPAAALFHGGDGTLGADIAGALA